jgi:hypothetical protein
MPTQEDVENRNWYNGIQNEIEGHMIRLLDDWHDKKVWKTSGRGGAVAKLEKQFNAYCESHGYNDRDGGERRIWLHLSVPVSSLTVTVKSPCMSGAYGSNDIRLGRVDDEGFLREMFTVVQRRTDYQIHDVITRLKRAKAMEDEARELRSSVWPFGK